MTEWYYADRQRRQIGPQSAEVLAQRFRAGEIDAATLVWRDGLPAWQPLGSLRGELGLDEARGDVPEYGDYDMSPLPVEPSRGVRRRSTSSSIRRRCRAKAPPPRSRRP